MLPRRQPPPLPAPAQAAADSAPAKSSLAPVALDQQELAGRINEVGPSLLVAFNRMLALWSVRAERIDAATASRCPALLSSGVLCLCGNAPLSTLARLGRPAVDRKTQRQTSSH